MFQNVALMAFDYKTLAYFFNKEQWNQEWFLWCTELGRDSYWRFEAVFIEHGARETLIKLISSLTNYNRVCFGWRETICTLDLIISVKTSAFKNNNPFKYLSFFMSFFPVEAWKIALERSPAPHKAYKERACHEGPQTNVLIWKFSFWLIGYN